jgi:hypothetical protein
MNTNKQYIYYQVFKYKKKCFKNENLQIARDTTNLLLND